MLRLVDTGIAASIFVVPMAMGGRHALGRLALTSISIAIAVAWLVSQAVRGNGTWRRSAAEWLLLAGLVLLVLQLLPLPPALLGHLAPHTSEMLPLWNAEVDASPRLGVWSQVSLTPAATRAALAIFLAYGLLFVVTVQRIRRLEDVERLLRWCALSAVLMASFGLVQLVAGNGKFFWFYRHLHGHTWSVATGAFANRNHFAHFLALGVGPLIWWVQEGFYRRSRQPGFRFGELARRSGKGEMAGSFRMIALGIVLFAILLSLSRGGALVTLLAVAISVGACYRASLVSPRFALGLGAVVLLLGVSLTIFGYDHVSRRLKTVTAGSLAALDGPQGRRTIWSTVVKASSDYRLVGSGVGSHREVYPMYLEWTDSEKYYSHAESGYLQVMLESGIAGLALLLSGVGICGCWCIGGLRAAVGPRMIVSVGAVSASLAVSVVHSLVDFVWYVPGCMAVVAVLAACACRLRQLATARSDGQATQIRLPRHVAAIGLVVLVGVGGWMLGNRVGPVVAQLHWDRFMILSKDLTKRVPFGIVQLESSETNQEHETAMAMTNKAVAELEEVVRWDPGHARAHLRLAESYVRLFHQKQQASANVMSVNQIRDAVIDSRAETVLLEQRLDSREELEQWLCVAIGDHYEHLDRALHHSRLALSLCPLLGEGYLFLGELCFLEGGRTRDKSAYVAQALKVRPFDGAVLLHAGNEAILAGHLDEGLAYWQDSFRRGPICQRQIVDWLAGRVHPTNLEEEIRFFLETFQPDLDALRLIESRYRKIARPQQMSLLYLTRAQAAAKAAEKAAPPEAALLWLDAMRQYRVLRAPEERLQCGRNAYRSDPNSCRVREMLARCLADLGHFAEAKDHLNWCIKRKPDNDSLHNKMKEIVRREIVNRQVSQEEFGRPVRNAADRQESDHTSADRFAPPRPSVRRQASRPQYAPTTTRQ